MPDHAETGKAPLTPPCYTLAQDCASFARFSLGTAKYRQPSPRKQRHAEGLAINSFRLSGAHLLPPANPSQQLRPSRKDPCGGFLKSW